MIANSHAAPAIASEAPRGSYCPSRHCAAHSGLCATPPHARKAPTGRHIYSRGWSAQRARNPRDAFEERTNPEGVAQWALRYPRSICTTPSGFDSILCQYRGFRMLRMLHPRLYMCRPIRGFAFHPRAILSAPFGALRSTRARYCPPHSGLRGGSKSDSSRPSRRL